MPKKFKGIGCPCVTPFNEDGTIDITSLRELVDYLINSEINAIIPTASCGESYTLSDEEYHLIIDTIVDQVNNAVPVYVGMPSESPNRLLKIADYATKAGADGVVIYPPKIPTLTSNELVAHYQDVCSKIEKNVLIVNDPDNCGVDLSVKLISKIAKFSHVVGIIELRKKKKKLVPQAIIEGGVEGAIVSSANVVPNLLVELYESYTVELNDRFMEIKDKLLPLEIGLKLGTFPAAIKASLNLLGVEVGNPRKPVSPLSKGNVEKLKNILIAAGCLRAPVKEENEDGDKPEEK
ncbi:MAG: dihydrodipicolinate synthase family protein [Candidatus Heimdallarchaeota archaeon]